MKESKFIEQNKKKWQEFEGLLKKDAKNQDPDKINELFIKVTDDLSYARTFYPNRSVRVYLNRLGQKIYQKIYKRRRLSFKKLLHFWTEDLPQNAYACRRQFLISFILFWSCFAIGWFSSAQDPEFTRQLLGDGYIEMTLENIEKGDPMGVYKDSNASEMTFGIAVNNLKVGFTVFVMGVLFGIGTIAIVLYNGIMIGSFQHFFYDQGLFTESFLTIWVHGTLEISTIIIECTAGLVMGSGLVFPGSLNRIQAFQRSAKRGVKIMLGGLPLVVLAAIIEGYLTRFTETPDIVRGLFIFVSFAFVVIYFGVYPRYKAKKGFKSPLKDTKLPPNRSLKVDYTPIKSVGKIFSDTFMVYKKCFKPILKLAFFGALIYGVIFFFMYSASFDATEIPFSGSMLIYFLRLFAHFGEILIPFVENLYKFQSLFAYENYPGLFFLALGFVPLLITSAFYFAIADTKKSGQTILFKGSDFFKFLLVNYWKSLFFCGIILTFFFVPQLLFMSSWFSCTVLLMLFAPLLIFMNFVSIKEKRLPFVVMGDTFKLLSGGYWKSVGLFGIMGLVSLLFLSFNSSVVLTTTFDMINWNIDYQDSDNAKLVVSMFFVFMSMLGFGLILPLFGISFGMLYNSQQESVNAVTLKEKINEIGVRKTFRGLESE